MTNEPFNGIAPKPIVKVTIVMLDNGQVQAHCESIHPFAAFHAIGKGMEALAIQFQKQAAQAVQVAPPGFVLPN